MIGTTRSRVSFFRTFCRAERNLSTGAAPLKRPQPQLVQYLLRFQSIVLTDPAALKEAVAHHGLAKQKNDHYQDD
jgi:hypothetical protein